MQITNKRKNMKKHLLNMTSRPLAWIWLVILFCHAVRAAAPDWRSQIVSYPNYTGVLARVKLNGATVSSEGSLLAAFHGDEVSMAARQESAASGSRICRQYVR